jgi:hypothetical protein
LYINSITENHISEFAAMETNPEHIISETNPEHIISEFAAMEPNPEHIISEFAAMETNPEHIISEFAAVETNPEHIISGLAIETNQVKVFYPPQKNTILESNISFVNYPSPPASASAIEDVTNMEVFYQPPPPKGKKK